MTAIFKRELRAYFTHPIGYVFMCVLLLFSGIYFSIINLFQGFTSMTYTLNSLQTVFFFLAPILTMRMFSEERRNKVDQLLITAPVKVSGIVLGKYLAAVCTFLIVMAVTFINLLILRILTPFSIVEALVCYIGFGLFGAALIAIGMWISSLTESQVVSAIATYAVFLLLMLTSNLAGLITNTAASKAVEYLSPTVHFASFSQGLLSVGDLVYYLSVIVLFLFLTGSSIEKRRWR